MAILFQVHGGEYVRPRPTVIEIISILITWITRGKIKLTPAAQYYKRAGQAWREHSQRIQEQLNSEHYGK